MEYVKYAVLAVVAFFAWRFLSRGMSAFGSVGPAMNQGSAGWVSGPGGAYTGYYGFPGSVPPAYAFGGNSRSINAGYSPDDNSFSFGYSDSSY